MASVWKQRLLYLLILLGAGAFYLAFSGYLSFFILWLVIFLPVLLFGVNFAVWVFIKTVYALPLDFQLRAGGDGAAARGQDIPFEVEIENETFFHFALIRLIFLIENPMTGEQVKEKVNLPLNSHDAVRLQLNTHSPHCGNLTVTLRKAKCYDCLGLTALPIRLRLSAKALVLPDVFPMETGGEAGETHSDEGVSYAPDHPGHDTSQVFDYHEYREGDRLKNIHWKLSNRLDRLMVKEFSEPLSSTVRVVLELNGGGDCSPELLDRALSACMSLSESLLAGGYSYTLEWFDNRTGEPMRIRVPAPDGVEEFLIALGEVCGSRPFSGTPLLDSVRTEELGGVSELVYITPLLDEATVDKLVALGHMAPLNVICAQKTTGAAELLDTSSDFSVMVLE